MRYDPGHKNILAAITYGSHLYGTSTPTSDHDFKAITLPPFRDLLLSKTLHVERYRFDVDGNPVGHQTPMGDNGYEAEHTPVQKFVHDYLGGQAYAVELVHAVMQGFHVKHVQGPYTGPFEALCETLSKDFLHKNVNGMVGFAVKQTFDYVRRGERLNAARAVLAEVDVVLAAFAKNFSGIKPSEIPQLRLDSQWSNPPMVTVLDELVARTGLTIGEVVNRDKKLRTLQLNGRDYLETTTVQHLRGAIEKLIDGYGERSTKASETDVDWKSLSHAVRVYQQVEELLQVGMITFPRPNAEALLRIRKGECKLESVRDLLRDLDDNTTLLVAESKLPAADDAMRAAMDEELLPWLMSVYYGTY
jgi:Fe-S cluster biosynthesis and repair protein YggX